MAPIHLGTSDVKINYGVQTAAPTSPSPTEGSEYWHKTKNKKYIYDGTIWNSVTTSAPIQAEQLLIGGLKMVYLIMMGGLLRKVVRI